jgi:hypothetical protein
MTTLKLLSFSLVAAVPLLSGWDLARVSAQDQKREDLGGQPFAVPGDRNPGTRFDGRGAGQPPNFEPGAANPGDAGFDSGAPRDPNAPRRSRGDGRGMPGGRGQFGPGSPMPNPFGMRPNDPEMEKLIRTDVELDRQSRDLAERFRGASKDEQDDIKKKLSDVVTKQFEARQERRTLELKHLEDEIKRIRESIDKRNQGKQQIVDRRVSELLGQDDNSF